MSRCFGKLSSVFYQPDLCSPDVARCRIDEAMRETGEFLRIATVNPEFLLLARSNEKFRAVLKQADMCIADGVGVALMARLMHRPVQRYAGADLFFDILDAAEKEGWSVHFFCRADGLSQWHTVQRVVRERYPQLQVTGEDVRCEGIEAYSSSSIHKAPAIYIANFGAPQQEYFLEALRAQGATGVAVGVGGAVDFLTGAVPRAPRWMRRWGVEWIYRTIHQPHRLGKMLRSVVVFPVIIIYNRVLQSIYRLLWRQ